MSLIAEGKHLAECRGIELGESSKGTPYAKIDFVLTEEGDDDRGRHITGYLYFTDKATDRAIQSLRFMGWTGSDIAEIEGLAMNGDLSKPVIIVVKHEEFNGKVRDKVQWINDPDATGKSKPMSAESKQAFADRVKHALGHNSGNPGDDGLPF